METNTSGWDAITNAFLKLYPGQTEPKHFASLISYRLGGDPLDGVSVYDGGSFYHFVTYGFSELYGKESDDLEYSGYGFELTLKLKKLPLWREREEMLCVCNIFQSLAESTFSKGEIFCPSEYIYTGQTTGIDAEGKSAITGFVTVEDAAGEIVTPNGKVQFVQLVGMTDAELQTVIQGQKSISALLGELGNSYTDYQRSSLI